MGLLLLMMMMMMMMMIERTLVLHHDPAIFRTNPDAFSSTFHNNRNGSTLLLR